MGMDFFGHQEQARKASKRLVWLYVAAVVCIILLIYGAALGLLVGTAKRGSDLDWAGLPLLGVVTAAVGVIAGIRPREGTRTTPASRLASTPKVICGQRHATPRPRRATHAGTPLVGTFGPQLTPGAR